MLTECCDLYPVSIVDTKSGGVTYYCAGCDKRHPRVKCLPETADKGSLTNEVGKEANDYNLPANHAYLSGWNSAIEAVLCAYRSVASECEYGTCVSVTDLDRIIKELRK